MRIRLVPVQQPNTCGECTLCCKVLGIQEIQKPKDKWCKWAAHKKGCTVYDMRPKACHIFECVWIAQQLPPHYRPDKIHGVLTPTEQGTDLCLFEDPGYPGVALDKLRQFINGFVSTGKRFVVVVTGTKRQLIAHKDLLPHLRIKSDTVSTAEYVGEIQVEYIP